MYTPLKAPEVISEPSVFWNTDNDGGANYRLVIKYYPSSADKRKEVVLEKYVSGDEDALGVPLWKKVSMGEFPQEALIYFAEKE